jgi:hypothetical protein
MDLAERVRVLEERLDALERAQLTSAGAPPVVDEDRFWVLAGLKAKLPERSAVVFAGAVTTEAGAAYEWQQGVLVDDLPPAGDLGPVADSLAALAHPVRLRLLLAVLDGRATAAELGAIEGSGTTGQLYHHLRQLTAAGWVRAAGRGHYEIPAERVVPALVCLAAARR